MKRTIFSLIMMAAFLGAAVAADLSVEAQFNLNGKEPTKSFLSVKGSGASVTKDTVDTVTGASKNKGTEVLNSYRNGADGKSTLPGGIQSLLKYGVSPESQYLADGAIASKAADGTITVQYLHRGRAYKMVSDKKGIFSVPAGNYKSRVIAVLQKDGTNMIAKEFSSTGKIADINWAKVWDTAVPAGTLLATSTAADGKVTEIKTGPVMDDLALSSTPYVGSFQLTLTGTFLTIKADLDLKK